MRFLTEIFAAGFRLAASLNRTAGNLDKLNDDFEARLDAKQTPRLTTADVVDRGADTVTSPAKGANGKAARR